MIIDHITNRACYEAMNPQFSLAFDFIERVMERGAETGRYELDGDRVYAMVQEYEGKEDHPVFEGHRKYLDIQFILSGRERMEAAAADACAIDTEYREDKDIAFFTCHGDKVTMELGAGELAIFYPQDLHKPGIRCAEGGVIRKIVVKIRLS